LRLLRAKFPDDDFQWLVEYRNNYVTLYNF
jgi:hypothetical protein